MDTIKSISYSQDEILASIMKLYCPDGFELDPTYSKGCFYRNIPEPRLKFDIQPQIQGVQQADCVSLPLVNSSISSIVFDPPFIIRHKAPSTGCLIKKRFGAYHNISALWDMYHRALDEFYRVLKQNGVLVFKCQDTIDDKQYLSHVEIINKATSLGFYARDLFVLLAKSRMTGGLWKVQHHARKWHSYFLVFEKRNIKVQYTGMK